MADQDLPSHPSLEQYKKQAKDLAKNYDAGTPAALYRATRHGSRHKHSSEGNIATGKLALTEAQLIIAREHGFESWPKFAAHIEMLNLIRSVAGLNDPVAAFIEVACVPRHADHTSGSLEPAEMILQKYPDVGGSNIYTAAILGDEARIRSILQKNPKSATASGGPHDWDPLTYLCFSRYLRLDRARRDSFVRAAQVLLDAGASAHTGWHETVHSPKPRTIFESAIYGAACIARHGGLTQLLLERGADPNDEETPYHAPEGYDNEIVSILLKSGKLSGESVATMLLRKIDWHDEEGVRILLAGGADPNLMTKWGANALQHAVRRHNHLNIIDLLLDRGADPTLPRPSDGMSAIAMAARRGRGDVLHRMQERGTVFELDPVTQIIAACATGDRRALETLATGQRRLVDQMLAEGGDLLAEFAGNGNLEGVRCLLDLGVSPSAMFRKGDVSCDIAKDSTALHVAAWRARPQVVHELIRRGTPVNAFDGKGRTALALAVKACVDSYWMDRRSPDSIDALLRAGAETSGVNMPTGYDAIDELLLKHQDPRE